MTTIKKIAQKFALGFLLSLPSVLFADAPLSAPAPLDEIESAAAEALTTSPAPLSAASPEGAAQAPATLESKIPALPALKPASEADERQVLSARLTELRKHHQGVVAHLWQLRADYAKLAREAESATRGEPRERTRRLGKLLAELRLAEAGPLSQLEVLKDQIAYVKSLLEHGTRPPTSTTTGGLSEDPSKAFARLKQDLDQNKLGR